MRWGGRIAVGLALALGGVGQAAAAPTASGPPAAAVRPVVDDYFGVKITDDYRWMEDRTAPAFVAWAKAQNAYARTTLDAIPGRDALLKRIAAHTGGGVVLTRLKLAGGRLFYLKRAPGENGFRLFVREGLAGAERVLVDPDAIPTSGPHFAIDYFAPSLEGDKLAYGISPGGSENSVIHVLDVATGRESGETIDRAESGAPSWLPGGQAFVYNRYAKVAPGAKETDKYLNSRALLHRVGADPETDRPLIGTGVPGSPSVTPVDQPFIATEGGSPYALGIVSHGADPDTTFYVAPLAELSTGAPHWRKVADVADKVSDVALSGDRLYLLSHKRSPRFEVLETAAAAPDLAHARVAVPAGQRVIQGFAVSKDGVLTIELDGGVSTMRRIDPQTAAVSEVVLPIQGAISGVTAGGAENDVLIGLQGWVTPATIYRLQGGQVSPTAVAPPWADDLSPFESKEITATAQDGTTVPLSVVYKKGLKLDGGHPIWLTGYGAYGVALQPALAARYLAFLEDGGVYAVAHVRGGGEFGEDWHQAGRIATKPNTWNDLIACAEHLVKSGYGRPEALAIEGRSAGGITVGRALTSRPDLFRVVFSGVGDNNTLRSENGTDGPANSLEYGSVATEAGFRALLESDSTQHVRPGVAYPAVLITTGMNDPRVAPWQPGKMAAHLQAATSSGRPVLMLVDFDAGHGVGSTKAQRDQEMADQMAFFYWQIGKPGYQPPAQP